MHIKFELSASLFPTIWNVCWSIFRALLAATTLTYQRLTFRYKRTLCPWPLTSWHQNGAEHPSWVVFVPHMTRIGQQDTEPWSGYHKNIERPVSPWTGNGTWHITNFWFVSVPHMEQIGQLDMEPWREHCKNLSRDPHLWPYDLQMVRDTSLPHGLYLKQIRQISRGHGTDRTKSRTTRVMWLLTFWPVHHAAYT